MLRLAFSFLLIFSFAHAINAQITLDPQRDSEQNVVIYAVNPTKIPYSLIINFSDLQNMTTSGGGNTVAVASPGRSKVATLKPTLAGQGTNYRYSFSFAKGNIYGKTKVEPIYLIPVADGTAVTAHVNTNISKAIKSDVDAEAYVGVSFVFEEATTIVAPRKGVIAEMKMDYRTESDNLAFAADENYIEIFHEDGTLTRLKILKAGSEKVQVGDVVLPGQALAESAGDKYQNGPHVLMINFKPVKADLDKFKYTYFPVVFAAKEGNLEIKESTKLTATQPQEVVTMELSKKELKQLQESN